MKIQRIQQPERYEAPKVKVKELRKRAVLVASVTLSDLGSEGTSEDPEVSND